MENIKNLEGGVAESDLIMCLITKSQGFDYKEILWIPYKSLQFVCKEKLFPIFHNFNSGKTQVEHCSEARCV